MDGRFISLKWKLDNSNFRARLLIQQHIIESYHMDNFRPWYRIEESTLEYRVTSGYLELNRGMGGDIEHL